MEAVPTFQQIDEAMRGLPEEAGRGERGIGDFCTYWPAIKPILQVVKRLVPEKWRVHIDTFIEICDGLCGQRS